MSSDLWANHLPRAKGERARGTASGVLGTAGQQVTDKPVVFKLMKQKTDDLTSSICVTVYRE